jgi:hypothetical protein
MVSGSSPSGIYRWAITIWRHLKESLRPKLSVEKAVITYIHIRKARREFSYKINRIIYGYRRDFSIYWKDDVLFQLKIRGASEKLKNQPRPLLRPRSVNFLSTFSKSVS